MRNLELKTFVLLVLMALPAAVSAQGAGQAGQTGPTGQTVTVASPALAHLETQIALDREARPELYATVEAIRLQAPELDARARGPLAVMGPAFSSLGSQATLAVVDALLRDPGFDSPQPPSVRRASRIGMLNALRDWRDPAARPALEAIIDSSEKDLSVLRAASESLAVLLDDAAVDFLIARSSGTDARSLAIASGLGMCRRVEVASFLAGRVATTSGEARAVYLEALGDVANSWAWKTDVVAASGESVETRIAARDALLSLYLSTDGKVSHEATKNILLADAPGTVELLQELRLSASVAERERIDWLLERVRNNPLHRRR